MKIKWRYVILAALVLVVLANACGKTGTDSDDTSQAPDAGQVSADSQSSDPDAQAEELELLKNVPLSKGLAKINEFGFTPSYLGAKSEKDLSAVIDTSDKDLVNEYTITEVVADAYNKTVDVYIASKADLKSIKTEEQLSKKLESGTAWVAAESYGEAVYPYGFELHYLVGRITQEAEDKNTWYLKAECTVTNQYGAEQDATCEAKVTGTTDSPEVTSFGVY